MVFVEPADDYEFLGAFDLVSHEEVLPADAGLQGQAAVRPELPLGAEPVWVLYKRELKSCTNRTHDAGMQPAARAPPRISPGHHKCTRPVALWDSSTRARGCIKQVPARPVQDQNGGCEESPGTPAYPPCTACGLLEACSRGRCRRYTEGFRGGLESLPSIAE